MPAHKFTLKTPIKRLQQIGKICNNDAENRPRKSLDFKSPNEVLALLLSLILESAKSKVEFFLMPKSNDIMYLCVRYGINIR